jgi:hypothetical protein
MTSRLQPTPMMLTAYPRRPRWKNLAAANENHDDGSPISNLQVHAATADDRLEGELVAKDDKTNHEHDADHHAHSTQRDLESLMHNGEVVREREPTIRRCVGVKGVSWRIMHCRDRTGVGALILLVRRQAYVNEFVPLASG